MPTCNTLSTLRFFCSSMRSFLQNACSGPRPTLLRLIAASIVLNSGAPNNFTIRPQSQEKETSMKCVEKKIARAQRVSEYASPADFQDVFARNMSQLFLVALLLVGDELKAEQCFIRGIEDCVKGNPVFKEWAH